MAGSIRSVYTRLLTRLLTHCVVLYVLLSECSSEAVVRGVPRSSSYRVYASGSKPRKFWGWKSDECGSDRVKKSVTQTRDSSSSSGSSSSSSSNSEYDSNKSQQKDEENPLVAQFGDITPKVSPLLVLPLSRRPVFPGFFATHLVKDEKTLEAIIENHKKGVSYLGLFLRKSSQDGSSDSGRKLVGQSYEEREGESVKDGHNPAVITSLSDVHPTGTYVQIHNVIKTARGGQLLLMAHRRIRLDEIVAPPNIPGDHSLGDNSGPDSTSQTSSTPAMGRVTFLKMRPSDAKSATIKAYANEIIVAVRDLVKMNPMAQEHIHEWASRMDFSDPMKLTDFAASITSADGSELQRVLTATDPEERLSITLELLNKERKIAEFQKDISRQVEEKMNKQQREFMLRQQLKAISKELGIDKDDKSVTVAKFQARVDALKANGGVLGSTLDVMQEEINKLSGLERSAPEFNVVRSYLDWLTVIPYNTYSRDELNLTRASHVLERDHLGMKDVKKQILEFIAVGRLKDEQLSGRDSTGPITIEGSDRDGRGASGSIANKVLCLIGPPGVGKTSIAKSIAAALNRKFHRFSVGGLTDIAEIKGHRRTYIGAMPGKPVQILKAVGTSNPVVLIDELDKLGKGYQGDPASALLELLDPSHNQSFVDHYLDVPVDFSRTLFICTANDESAIPAPLRDRMDILRLSGYDIPEKVAIAKQYLVPKIFKAMGLQREEVDDKTVGTAISIPHGIDAHISDDALEALIRNYCRESGIRSLEKHIEKIARRIAFLEVSRVEAEVAKEGESGGRVGGSHSMKLGTDSATTMTPYCVTAESLEEFLGSPKYSEETLYSTEDTIPPGVVMGLAWNPLGGAPVFIEAVATPVAFTDTGGSVQVVTGQLGDVMKESVNIAYTYARQYVRKLNASNDFFKTHQLHIHCPEGAVGKDGPSAGITIASALISLAIDTPVSLQLAMTGEISLTGKVLPVGGIKEKILAARRSGAKRVILPSTCRRDFKELPAFVKESLEVFFATTYDDVFNVAFGDEKSLRVLNLRRNLIPKESVVTTAAAIAASAADGEVRQIHYLSAS